jgi:hypothetical protein
MSTRYRESLKKHISNLAVEHVRLDNQFAAAVEGRPTKGSSAHKRKHMQEVIKGDGINP